MNAALFSLITIAHADTTGSVEWRELTGTAIADPLSTMPPIIVTGKPLPGDRDIHFCGETGFSIKEPLTLYKAIDIALCHNPTVRSAWDNIKVSAAQVGEARSAYFPNINLGFSRIRQKTVASNAISQLTTKRINNSRYISLTWKLLDFGKRKADRLAANALLRATLASYDVTLQKTILNTIELYFAAQTAQVNQQSREKITALVRRIVQKTKAREARGASSLTDILQAETSLARAELESIRARGLYQRSLVALIVALGMPLQTELAQKLNLSSEHLGRDKDVRQDLTHWLTLVQSQHPQILALQAELVVAKQRLIAIQAEGLPSLSLSYNQYVNGRPDQGVSATNTKETIASLTLNIPIFEGFSRTYKVRSAQAQIEIKAAQLQEVGNQVLGEVAQAHADTLAALDNLQASKYLIETAQETLEKIQHKYDMGASDILELLNAQTALLQAEQERIRTLAEWDKARLSLLASAGVFGLQGI